MHKIQMNGLLRDIHETYVKDRFVTVGGLDIIRILAEFGVRDEDSDALETVGDHPVPDPTFTRKPTTEGHISCPYDSFSPHLEFPLSLDIPAPPIVSPAKKTS
ncbi:hypothetical protein AA13594_3224 [Gluconacetobacter azotocaptans DSM 13594]|nr:hypothetical protein AA13594_3224 [Gluconacetobacter azotocaptans DSM 13594]